MGFEDFLEPAALPSGSAIRDAGAIPILPDPSSQRSASSANLLDLGRAMAGRPVQGNRAFISSASTNSRKSSSMADGMETSPQSVMDAERVFSSPMCITEQVVQVTEKGRPPKPDILVLESTVDACPPPLWSPTSLTQSDTRPDNSSGRPYMAGGDLMPPVMPPFGATPPSPTADVSLQHAFHSPLPSPRPFTASAASPFRTVAGGRRPPLTRQPTDKAQRAIAPSPSVGDMEAFMLQHQQQQQDMLQQQMWQLQQQQMWLLQQQQMLQQQQHMWKQQQQEQQQQQQQQRIWEQQPAQYQVTGLASPGPKGALACAAKPPLLLRSPSQHRIPLSPGMSPSPSCDDLEAFLAQQSGTGGAAGARRQRRNAEAAPFSQQFLSTEVTRRDRRASCDSAVTEMRPWVEALCNSPEPTSRRMAAKAIRLAIRDGPENRMRLVGAGGVRPLVSSLRSRDKETVEHASAALLHLSLAWDSAVEVMGNGAVRALIDVLAAPDVFSETARSNSAASLFALSRSEENQRLVYAGGAVPHLSRFLWDASTKRSKKDACLALYNMCQPGAAGGVKDMVAAGVVKRAVQLLEEAEEGVEEKVAALLGCLARTPEGREGMEEEEDLFYTLVDTIEGGTSAAAEQAAITLYHLVSATPSLIPQVLAEGVLPPLVRLAVQSKKGSDSRALLSLLRKHCAKRAREESEELRGVMSRISFSLPRPDSAHRMPRLSISFDRR